MEKEMRGLYIVGVANRGGPESCVGVREDVGEALTGVRAGWAIEPRNSMDRDADAVISSGRLYRLAAFSRVAGGVSRGRRTWACARSLHAREPGGPMGARGGGGWLVRGGSRG